MESRAQCNHQMTGSNRDAGGTIYCQLTLIVIGFRCSAALMAFAQPYLDLNKLGCSLHKGFVSRVAIENAAKLILLLYVILQNCIFVYSSVQTLHKRDCGRAL